MNNEIKMLGPSITNHEIKKINEMMNNGWDSYQYVEEFEKRFAQYHGKKFCLMTSCCTHAIHLGLMGIGLKSNDEVIVPECTWTGTVAPITYIGARPIFADISLDNWCLKLESIQKAITPKTKAIICVDLYGQMPEYQKLEELCNKNNIVLIEDAAEALGSSQNSRLAGTFGRFSVHSFHRTKTITTGEGGALITDDHDLYERCLFLRDHGRSKTITYFIEEPSVKYMPSNIMGALGCAQLDRIDELLKIKSFIRDNYLKLISREIIDMSIISDRSSNKNGCWATTIVIHNQNFDRNLLIKYFESQLIPLRPFFYCLTDMPAYQSYKIENFNNNNAKYLSSRGITLPSHYKMTYEQISFISKTLNKYMQTI